MTYLWLLQLLGQSDAWIPAGLGVDDVTVENTIVVAEESSTDQNRNTF